MVERGCGNIRMFMLLYYHKHQVDPLLPTSYIYQVMKWHLLKSVASDITIMNIFAMVISIQINFKQVLTS